MESKNKKSILSLVVMFLFIFTISAPVLATDKNTLSETSNPIIIGSGDFDYVDGMPDEAAFRFPNGLAYAKKANAIIIADTQNHMIRSLDLTTLKVTTIAGKSEGLDRFGFPGGAYVDGELKDAMFNRPKGIAVADNGAIIIADTHNHAIRQIFDGKVTTIAGGTLGYKNGQGAKASFNNPSSLAIDKDDNIYVADTLNNAIRKIDTKGNVTTYAGKTDDTSILNEPTDLVADKDGNLYVVDSSNHQVKKISGKDTLETVAGTHSIKDIDSNYWLGAYMNGPADMAYFNFPKGLALKDNTSLYIADTYNHVIREIKANNVTTIVGANLAGEKLDAKYLSYMDGPSKIVYAKKMLFIADQWNNRILLIPDKEDNLRPITDYLDGLIPGASSVFLDGSMVDFPDVKPLILGEEIKIPIRALTEKWEADIEWDEDKQEFTIQKNGRLIGFALQAEDFTIYQDRSLLSIDTLQKKLGFRVSWLKDQNMVTIQSK
ncbi:MAG TPA: hypothetical protein VFD02_01490 [Syntrophomonadaceae bacterium]|nr:hypothetical protein [Syntrophomonadaceae bacterium]